MNAKATPTGTQQEDDNRRSHRREPVDLLLNRFLEGFPYLCRATDLSPGGIRLVPMLEPETKQKHMGLQFQLPGTDQVISASGEAVFTDGTQGAIGVRFTHLSPIAADTIKRYLAGAGSPQPSGHQ